MDWRQLLRLLGICSLVIAIILSIVTGYSWFKVDPAREFFALVTAGTYLITLLFLSCSTELGPKTWHIPVALRLVMISWVWTTFLAALPWWLSGQVNFVDSLFIGVSGLTTTGAEVLDLAFLSQGWLLYHQLLQLVGGLGIILLATTLVPALKQVAQPLYRIDVIRSDQQSKWLPRWSGLVLWIVGFYFILWIACSLTYKMCGLDWFSALTESMGTVSTGGFTIHNQSLEYYHSGVLLVSASLFMLVGAIGFSTHYIVFSSKSLAQYLRNSEVRLVLIFIVSIALFLSLWLKFSGNIAISYQDIWFNTISMLTTTGLRSADLGQWPGLVPWLLMTIALFGGCSGSTSGGLKMWRLQLIISDIKNALDLLLHPQAVFSDSDWSNLDNHLACRLSRGFFALYCLILLFGVFVLSLTGLSMSGAFSAAIASISNTGAGVGEVSQSYASLSSSSKVVMIILMLAGRLEILPILLVLRGLHPKSWLRYIR